MLRHLAVGCVLIVILALGAVGGPLEAIAVAAKTDVYVVGTLYRRHETVATYDLETVRRIILAVKPDVLVVDCTPAEVRERRVHASKIEYAQVIFPLMQEGAYKVYPAEPDEPLFTEIVQSGSAARATFEKTRPQDAAALQDYVKATYAALATHWRTPADVQDTLTGQVLTAKVAFEGRTVGTAANSERWNQHWTDAIRRAVAENPGKRVLALTGIENRAWIVNALSRAPEVELVDVPAWLRANLR
jgi:hypothetical protein